MDGTGENEGRCRPEAADYSLFCEMRCLETLKSKREI